MLVPCNIVLTLASISLSTHQLEARGPGGARTSPLRTGLVGTAPGTDPRRTTPGISPKPKVE